MNRAGFTLVELLVVIGLISLLLGIGTFQFAQYLRKSAVESQTRKLYSDLLEFRSRALFEKRNKTMKFTATSYAKYSTTTTTGAPVEIISLKRPITRNNSADIVFDARGMLPNAASSGQTICVTEENDAAVDSVVVSMTRVQIGKRDEEMACDDDNVVFK